MGTLHYLLFGTIPAELASATEVLPGVCLLMLCSHKVHQDQAGSQHNTLRYIIDCECGRKSLKIS